MHIETNSPACVFEFPELHNQIATTKFKMHTKFLSFFEYLYCNFFKHNTARIVKSRVFLNCPTFSSPTRLPPPTHHSGEPVSTSSSPLHGLFSPPPDSSLAGEATPTYHSRRRCRCSRLQATAVSRRRLQATAVAVPAPSAVAVLLDLEMAHLYKSRLQNYAQKRNVSFPVYACEMQGPPHARLFKARVTIDGATFEGPEFCTTLKDAEHAAAKVAFMALSPDGTLEDDCLYKSLLQELAQKKGLLLPVYATNRTGQPHMPCFASTVEIAGECYVGQEARTKKQAEMNAAKVAFIALTEGGQRTNNAAAFSDIQTVGASISGSSSSHTVSTDDKESTLVHTTNKMRAISINDPPSYPIAKEPEKPKEYFGLKNLQDGLYMALNPLEDIEKHTMSLPPAVIHRPQPKTNVADVANVPPAVIHRPQPKANVADVANVNIMRENLIAREGSGTNGKSYQSFVSDVTSKTVKDLGATMPRKTKIVIRPHVLGMTYEGPIQVSDEEWVAMKVIVEDEM
ncbi:hypothetical protein L1887_19210 [Cichorium endivia]|nr:hypothetical protein L1887_19210 [Cichorium endivia]